jgi:hypothetical protein
VAGILITDPDTGEDFLSFLVRQTAKLAHGGHSFFGRINGPDRSKALPQSFPIDGIGFFFGKKPGIFEHDSAQIPRRLLGIYRPGETALDQQGQSSGVIDVSVTEDNRIHRCGIKRPWFPISGLVLPRPLDHSAIEKNP